MAFGKQISEVFFRDFDQNFTDTLMRSRTASLAHAHIQINKGVIFRAPMRIAVKQGRLSPARTAIGNRVVRRRISQHAGTASGKDLFARFIDHAQHGVGQVTAQDFHIGFGVQLTGIQNDQMRHESTFKNKSETARARSVNRGRIFQAFEVERLH